MQQAISIKTDLGILNGRDCIYLEEVKQDAMDNLIFTGDINGALVSLHKNEKEWFGYRLTFSRVLVYFSCELDTYENLEGSGHLDNSCFDIIDNSDWLHTLPIREDFDKKIYKHYRVFTYDMVYNIIAVNYQFDVDT